MCGARRVVLAPIGLAKVTLPPNERMQLTWLIGAPSRPVSVHGLVVGRFGLGSPATQLMRAVSWHDNAGVSSPGGGEVLSRCRAESGRRSVGFVAELGSTKRGWLAKSRAVRIPTSHSRLLAGEAGWLSCVSAGGALAESVIAGPHVAERRVVFGVRAGGLLEAHAAVGLVLAANRKAKTRRTESVGFSRGASRRA